jgi:hypothetical protein
MYLLSKEKFDVDSHSQDRGDGLIARSTSSHKGNNSSRSKSRSKSSDDSSELFCCYCLVLDIEKKEERNNKAQKEKTC